MTVALAGCTALTPAEHTSAAHPAPATKAVATTSVTVATGTLTSPDHATTGSVKIEKTDGLFSITVSNFATRHQGQVLLLLNEQETSVCDLAAYAWIGPGAAPESILTALLPSGPPGWTDPSNFVALTIAQNDPAGTEGCDLKGIATAPLTWTLANPRPSLRPTDFGARSGARGVVTSNSGVPASYLVAVDDTYTDIAARFGISIDDLEYLNPGWTQADYAHPGAISGTHLNLDPAKR
ncbi:LysM peptidoglycan-binding domain-containing protein [Diaminobutyricibacter tongyongensis]|uniref:LysM peptidoglycan-binding domain-containing protein n=1 Tax=Leifsonia tongyongensis TaxID=1268043 RepID=A0A6L9XTV4_9MICO|nr:LysM domain-containing protein [Diaminobutyricibacter tongyongensis]NEN04715.1 LysM peptidoglycan-binding domain-containing protein [Diaminobutyricibacter tongyongensis]